MSASTVGCDAGEETGLRFAAFACGPSTRQLTAQELDKWTLRGGLLRWLTIDGSDHFRSLTEFQHDPRFVLGGLWRPAFTDVLLAAMYLDDHDLAVVEQTSATVLAVRVTAQGRSTADRILKLTTAGPLEAIGLPGDRGLLRSFWTDCTD